MIPDNNQHVIASKSYGNFEAYACTLANARAILANYLGNLASEVVDLAQVLRNKTDASTYLVPKRVVDEALKDIVNLEIGTPSRHLKNLVHGAAPSSKSGEPDTRPEVAVTQEMKDEVVLWAFKAGKDPRQVHNVSADALNELAPHGTLKVLQGLAARAGSRSILYVDGWVLEAAEELNVLQYGTWKVDAHEHRIVQRFLTFVRDYLVDTSDTDYEVTALKATY